MISEIYYDKNSRELIQKLSNLIELVDGFPKDGTLIFITDNYSNILNRKINSSIFFSIIESKIF